MTVYDESLDPTWQPVDQVKLALQQSEANLREMLALRPLDVLLYMQDRDPHVKDRKRFHDFHVQKLLHEVEFVWECVDRAMHESRFEEASQLLHESIGRARFLQTLAGLTGTLEVDSLAHVYQVMIGYLEHLHEHHERQVHLQRLVSHTRRA